MCRAQTLVSIFAWFGQEDRGLVSPRRTLNQTEFPECAPPAACSSTIRAHGVGSTTVQRIKANRTLAHVRKLFSWAMDRDTGPKSARRSTLGPVR